MWSNYKYFLKELVKNQKIFETVHTHKNPHSLKDKQISSELAAVFQDDVLKRTDTWETPLN